MGCGARTVRPWTGGLRPREGQGWGLQPMKAEAQLTSLGCVLAGAAEDSVADTLRQMGGAWAGLGQWAGQWAAAGAAPEAKLPTCLEQAAVGSVSPQVQILRRRLIGWAKPPAPPP